MSSTKSLKTASSREMTESPTEIARPRTISIASYLLALNALCLLLWWLIMPETVISNGAQVFFILLWGSAAISLYVGIGWVRHGILAVLLVSVVGLLNTTNTFDGWTALNLADQVTRLVALGAVVALYLPNSRHWFSRMRERQVLRLQNTNAREE